MLWAFLPNPTTQFNELCDASIAYLRGEEFKLYPDFQTGGSIDVSRYNDGERGGMVKVRAKINKIDNKTLSIAEVPFGKTVPGYATLLSKPVKRENQDSESRRSYF